MNKNVLVGLVIFGLLVPSNSKSKNVDDYSYLGEYCTPEKFLKVPCLKDFCAEIDSEMHVWANKRGSLESKLEDL